jgi:hypothetical protein
MLQLPETPRRADLRGFSAALSLVAAVTVGLVTLAAGARMPLAWALAGALAVGLLLTPSRSSGLAYDAWNRLARYVGRMARAWISGVAFLIVTVVGWTGSRLPWRTPPTPTSGWRVRSTLPASSFEGQGVEEGGRSAGEGWVRELSHWARRGNGWTWGLLPFLILLGIVDHGEVRAPTDRNYTLY